MKTVKASRRTLAIVLVITVGLNVSLVTAWFEFCTSSSILSVSISDCPFGVLFKSPQTIMTCMYPTAGEHIANLCTDDRDVETSRMVQYVDAGINDDDGPSNEAYSTDSCKDPGGDDSDPESKCTLEYLQITKDITIVGAADEPKALGEGGSEEMTDPFDDNETNIDNRWSYDVKNQTFRLFLYMNDLLLDENEMLPQMRLVKLIKLSFQVLRRHCSTDYVSDTFSREVEKAFLFLVRESDLEHVKDISVQEYSKINYVLEKCVKGEPPYPFYLVGTVCKSYTKVRSIKKTYHDEKTGKVTNRTHPVNIDNEFAFKWGKYDVPVDATWSAMDFTHGMCYGTFKDDMNSHHLYEQALQRLFTPELMYRWFRPAKIAQESFWNNVLRSYTDISMRNVDACIQASYLGSPYLHRLARPKMKASATTAAPAARRKRQADFSQSAWCLSSQEEKDAAFKQVQAKC